MKAKIRDTEIYFDIEGSGLVVKGDRLLEKPVAFVIHGGPGADHTSYKPMFSHLTSTLQLVYFDHRGQGRSARGDKATYTLDNNVEDMEALRQYLGLEKIVVIGTSYGGMVALSYAVRYPEKVSDLIVVASAANSQFLTKAKQNLAQRGTPEQQAIAEYLWQGNFKDAAQLQDYFQIMGSLYALNYNPTAAAKAWKRTILSVDAINVAFGGFLQSYNILNQLDQITAPTLVVAGQQDWICPPECSVEIAEVISQAKLTIFENCGHLIRVDQPKALLKAITQFVIKNHPELNET
jgi:proline iminopeptidase